MLASLVAITTGLTAAFPGGSAAELANFLHNETGRPAFVSAIRHYPELKIENPKALLRFDFLGDRLDASVPDQHIIAVSDNQLPIPHGGMYRSRSPVPPRDADGNYIVRNLDDVFEIKDGKVTKKKAGPVVFTVGDLRRLKWSRTVSCPWFVEKCMLAASFDSMNEAEFWKYVAISAFSKIAKSTETFKLTLNYDRIRSAWVSSLLSQADGKSEDAQLSNTRLHAELIRQIKPREFSALFDAGPKILYLPLGHFPGLSEAVSNHISDSLAEFRRMAANDDQGSIDFLQMVSKVPITESSVVVMVSSYDFFVSTCLRGPKPNMYISI